jgi:hypothetical protein
MFGGGESMNNWLTLLQGALAGGAVGAVVSPYFAQRSDRRAARAKAHEKLAEAENARWDESSDFPGIAIQLRTAVMIAGAPQLLLEKYITAGNTYRELVLGAGSSKVSRKRRSKPENWAGFLNMEAVMIAAMLSNALWHPWTGRIFLRLRFRFKLWLWRRRLMVMVIQGVTLDYINTGKLPDNDQMIIVASYCRENLPRYLRSGIPLRQRIRQRLKRNPNEEAVAAAPDA